MWMQLLTNKFVSLRTLTPLRFYKQLDGWLLGVGKPMRVRTHCKQLLVKRSQDEEWSSINLLHNSTHWHLMCGFCGCRTDIVYYITDYRCRHCTSQLVTARESIKSRRTAKRQATVGDYSMLSCTDERRIAMRLHLEEQGQLDKILTPVEEDEAISLIRYEACIEPRIQLDAIKNGSIVWSRGKYIWVDGRQ